MLFQCIGHTEAVIAVQFSPDGRSKFMLKTTFRSKPIHLLFVSVIQEACQWFRRHHGEVMGCNHGDCITHMSSSQALDHVHSMVTRWEEGGLRLQAGASMSM